MSNYTEIKCTKCHKITDNGSLVELELEEDRLSEIVDEITDLENREYLKKFLEKMAVEHPEWNSERLVSPARNLDFFIDYLKTKENLDRNEIAEILEWCDTTFTKRKEMTKKVNDFKPYKDLFAEYCKQYQKDNWNKINEIAKAQQIFSTANHCVNFLLSIGKTDAEVMNIIQKEVFDKYKGNGGE